MENHIVSIPREPTAFEKTFKKTLYMLKAMFQVDPIIPNMVAILLASGILVLLQFPSLFPKLSYYGYLKFIPEILILINMVKSARKSLILPVIAMALSVISLTLFNAELNETAIRLLKDLMFCGMIGLATSIFFIRS